MAKKKIEPVIQENIVKVEYGEEMKKSFIDYAMSVIVQRALPDVRDGLKPVHRRILYAMSQLDLAPNKSYRKSARIVGDVLGKYHPHGDSSVYEAMVRMSQEFNMLAPLVQGHGNFGSIDGDSPAAMRYTEAKLGHPAVEMLQDLEKNLVTFKDNFDGTLKEPVVLPSRFPNLLVNGMMGIAVGMATNIPSHNLNEVMKAIISYIDNPNITVEKMMKHLKGPDFPTGGIIVNQSELLSMYETGEGRIQIRARIEKEDAGYGKTSLIVTEIPQTYAGSKIKLIEKIENLAKDKKLEELSDIRDESSKDGIRLVLEVKKGVDVDKFMNKLYKKTPLQDNFNANFLALVDGKPETLNLKQMIHHFVEFQKEITTKRYEYLLKKAVQRQEVLDGLMKAHDMIDIIIEILRGSKDVKMAKACLMTGVTEGITFKTKKVEKEASKLDFTEVQTEAILEMKLQKLISLELEKLNEEFNSKREDIETYKDILTNETSLLAVIKSYLKESAKSYGKKRKTVIEEIELVEYVEEFKEEDLYVLIDRFGYVKTTDVLNYTRSGEETVKDFKHTLLTKNTDKISMFTKEGNLHNIKLMDIPKVKVKDKGVPLDTLVNIKNEETIILDAFQSIKNQGVLFTTEQGYVKVVDGKDYETNRSTIASTKLDAGDTLASIQLLQQESPISHMVIVTEKGYALKFELSTVPVMKKTGKGVKAIELTEGDKVEKVYLIKETDKELIVNINGKDINLRAMKTKKRNQVGVKF